MRLLSRPTFSLRAVFVATAVVAVGTGVIVAWLRARARSSAIQAIYQAGGSIYPATPEEQSSYAAAQSASPRRTPDDAVETIHISGRTLDAASLANMKSLNDARSVVISQCSVTGPILHLLRGMPTLHSLLLMDTELDPKDYAQIQHLAALTHLDLSGTNVGDKDLAYIAQAPSLEWLNLSWTSVSDAGIQRLRGMKSLQELIVSDTAVTARSVEALAGLPALRAIQTDSPTVASRVAELLPRVEVVSEE